MGFEYKIAFQVGDPEEIQGFLARLAKSSAKSGRPDYTVTLEPDGFYFCDHAKSLEFCRVFRRLIDEALLHSKAIVYEL